MIIDVHGHFVATEVLERLRREGSTYGITVVDGPPVPRLRIGDDPLTPPFFPDMHDLQRRQEYIRRTEVDVQVLSPWLETVGYTLPSEQGQRWSRLLNETLAREAAAFASASCYATMATVPLQDARQVVLGSDYPFPLGDLDPVRSVREAQLGAEATQAILSDNAQTLFRLA